MELLSKLFQIFLILIVIYLWNKYVVVKIIKGMANFHKKNTEIDNNIAINIFIENENNIIKFGKYFYWFGGVLASISILIN